MRALASFANKLRNVFAAAIKFLFKGNTILIQAVLAAFWYTRDPDASSKDSKARVGCNKRGKQQRKTIEAFLKEAETLILGPLDNTEALHQFSGALKRQFQQRMLHDAECMLPSYNSTLPTGFECGQYLSLDVGGSTLRVAMVELKGRGHASNDQASSRIVRMRSYHIGPDIKALEGLAFFNWMAARISETIRDEREQGESLEASSSSPILMGLSWSFPLE